MRVARPSPLLRRTLLPPVFLTPLDPTTVTSPALAQLRQLQRALYERAYAEAHAIVAGPSKTILAYSAKFHKSLPRRFQKATQADLIEEIRRHRLLLYGDFHTLRQSQRGLLRLLRAYVERQKTNKVVIALEMFKAIDQDTLDSYLGGAITEEEFLASVSYGTDWGFPWANFKMILDFARNRKLPVIGINTENAGRDQLPERDRFAARRLVWAAEAYPDHKIFCLIGEYHLADSHLPKLLASEAKRRGAALQVLRVLNNVDQYYFDMTRDSGHLSTEYLRLKKGFYCVMNSPPWMKWQSFSIWEEMRHAMAQGSLRDDDFGGDLDLYNEDSFDVDYQFLAFVRHLAGFLGMKVDGGELESFHIYFSPDGDFMVPLTEDGGLKVDEAERVIGRALTDGAFFHSRTKTVLVADISINNLAEAAGQYLHAVFTGFDDGGGAPAEDFYRRILKAAIGLISSKILNPRRQCLELHHFRRLIRRDLNRSGKAAKTPKLRIAHAVLRFDRWMSLRLAAANPAYAAAPRGVIQLDQETDYEVSRAIGQLLGLTLYKKVIANKEPTSRLRRLFRHRGESPDKLMGEIAALYRLVSP